MTATLQPGATRTSDGNAASLVVVGASWGGLQALSTLLDHLPSPLGAAVAIAQHRSADSSGQVLERLLQAHTAMRVCEGRDKQPIRVDHVYVAPPDYHLLVEDGAFALSVDAPVQHARPSIDVLFESAADAYGERVIGVLLTGANADGAAGLARIKQRGGTVIVQDPATAEQTAMPRAAIAAGLDDNVLPLPEIGRLVAERCASRSMA